MYSICYQKLCSHGLLGNRAYACMCACVCWGWVGVGMLSPELENQGGKSCREDSDKSLHLLMAAQAMKKRSQAGGQGSFLVSSSFSISSGQESVRRSQSGRAVV